MSETLLARIAWNYLIEPGDRIAGQLLSLCNPSEALNKLLDSDTNPIGELTSVELQAAYERWRPRLKAGKANQILDTALSKDIKPLEPTSEYWPVGLADLGSHLPLLLWYRGNIQHFRQNRAVAVVGSRTITHYGNQVTVKLSQELVSSGAGIISGGALGVDAVAHRSTLRAGGVTIGVMAGGLDCLYPSAHLELFDQIAHEGLLVSEMTPGANPTRWRFLQRNRIIACLADATVITEAGYRSGSINTANHANELGRQVFAVPGPINSPSSAGCNRLIQEGRAQMLADLDDLATELGWKTAIDQQPQGMGALELRLFDSLTTRSKPLEELAALAGLTNVEMKMAVGGLEMLGLIVRNGNTASKCV